MSSTPLVIIGTGGHGREALDIVEAVNRTSKTFDFLGFIDQRGDNELLVAGRGARIVGKIEDVGALGAHYVIGIGRADVRKRIDEQLSAQGCTAATLLHPSATLGGSVTLGPGVVLAAGARLTTNVVLGRHCHVNVNATISHDCRIGDYVTVSPGSTLCGAVVVGDGAMLGAGSTVIQNLTIGAWATVGAGAVVITDLPACVTAVGVPARQIAQ